MKLLKKTVKKGIAEAHRATRIFDRRFMKDSLDCEWPPVFIVGAPRSGTTLLYQLMMTAFRFAYIPNIANRFYMCPISACQFGIKICPPYHSSFSSTHGYEKGCMAPSEAGNIWNRWFPYENREGFNYTPSGWLGEKAKHEIYQLVSNYERLFAAPFISKNVKMSVRVSALYEIFPGAVFIHIKRDMKDVVLSNLVMRRKRGLKWASVMPKEIDEIIKLDEIHQVCHQIYYVEKNLAEDLTLYPDSAVLHLKYEQLCKNINLVIKTISSFASGNDIHLQQTNKVLPSGFNISKPKIDGWLEDKEINEIDVILSDLGQTT